MLNSDGEKPFALKFYQSDGLNIIYKYNLLSVDNPPLVIADTLNILSQLARLSKDYYEPIHRLGIYQDIKVLIQHPDQSKGLFSSKLVILSIYECLKN